MSQNTNAIDAEIAQAEIDMIACLEEAHKRAPELDWKTLTDLQDVRKYSDEIKRDMKALTGKNYSLLVTARFDKFNEPYFICKLKEI